MIHPKQKEGVFMLSKPEHGWADFSLGTKRYSLSYLSNIPWDWVDRATFGLETLLPFEVLGHCEPGSMVCTVNLSECRIDFELVRSNRVIRATETLPVSILEFCRMLHKDLSEDLDVWAAWNPSSHMEKEDLQARLDRLENLINEKANQFQ
jgi:hypothetical protein